MIIDCQCKQCCIKQSIHLLPLMQQIWSQFYAVSLLALPTLTIFAFSDIGANAGHSLGGAVATLSVLRLLKQLPQGATPTVRCVTFACPAIGNLALAEYVRASGWEHLFQNYLIPGWLPHPTGLALWLTVQFAFPF